MVRDWGHEVRAVHDGPAAWAAVAVDVPDLVLLDFGLPGMTGDDVARRLRRALLGRACAIVSLTGRDGDEARRLALAAGCDACLTKPVGPRELKDLLAGLPFPPRPAEAPEAAAAPELMPAQTPTPSLAHDLRNTLQRIQVCLRMMRPEVADRPGATDLLARAGRALDDLVRQLDALRQALAETGHADPLRSGPL